MKKLVFAVLILGGLGAGGYFLWTYLGSAYPETILPADTVVYVYFHDVREAARNLPKTVLWQQIQKSPRRKIYEKQLNELSYFFETTTGVNPGPLIKQFGRDLAFGLFSLPGRKTGGAFIAYVDNESETLRFLEASLEPSLKRRIPDLQKFGLTYNGITYYRFNSSRLPPGITPTYALANHHLLFAYTEQSLKTVLDIKKGNGSALAKSDVFRRAKRRILYRRGLLVFVDAQKALTMIHDSLSPARQKFWPAVVKIAGLNSLQSFIYNVNIADEGFRETGFLEVKPQREGLIKIYFQQEPQKLESVNSAPAESKVVNAGSLADFANMWDEVNAELNTILSSENYDKWQKSLNALRGIFNFDIRRDVLEPLGNEFCFTYEAPGEDASDPSRLRYLLILNLRNPQKFHETLDRAVSLATLRGLQQKQENYSGKKLQTFTLELGRFSSSPSYCLDGSWFLFATDLQLLKKAIDAGGQKKGIQMLADYQKVTRGFPDKVNGFSYTNISAYLQMYSAILSRKEDDPENRWIREYGVQEELASLGKNLFGGASYTRIEKDGMSIHSYASVPTSLLALPAVVAAVPEILKQYNARQSD